MKDSLEFTPKHLIPAFEQARVRETSSAPERWTPENRALGQCAVTAARYEILRQRMTLMVR